MSGPGGRGVLRSAKRGYDWTNRPITLLAGTGEVTKRRDHFSQLRRFGLQFDNVIERNLPYICITPAAIAPQPKKFADALDGKSQVAAPAHEAQTVHVVR